MDWSILTPHEGAHWDGRAMHFTPGVPRTAAPDDDALDDRWRAFDRSIFNLARLTVKKQHLPEKACAACGRPFTWRKKWERVWDEVAHRADCRSHSLPR